MASLIVAVLNCSFPLRAELDFLTTVVLTGGLTGRIPPLHEAENLTEEKVVNMVEPDVESRMKFDCPVAPTGWLFLDYSDPAAVLLLESRWQ